MSKIKEVLRLKYLNQLSNRQIQTMTGVSRASVANYIKSYAELGATLDEILVLSVCLESSIKKQKREV